MNRIAHSAALACAALCAATAAFGQATQVHITDSQKDGYVAHVSKDGNLYVREMSPKSYYHNATFNLNAGKGCTAVALPPGGTSLIVRQVRLDVFTNPTPGGGQYVLLYAGPCDTAVADVNPPAIGQTVVTFDPGLVIPEGTNLSADFGGSLQGEVYVDGYTVDPSIAPGANATASSRGAPPRQKR